jgi:hypothetical protein
MPPTKQAAQADPAPTLSTPFQDPDYRVLLMITGSY